MAVTYRVLALAAFFLWTSFCVYGAWTGPLDLFPTTGIEWSSEWLIRIALRVTIWALIWTIPVIPGLGVSIWVRRRRKR